MKHAIVVGASSGLGLAIAQRLTTDGYRVSALARRAAPAGAAAASYACDVTAKGEAARAVGQAIAAEGAPSVVVYASGHPCMGKTLDVPEDEARRAFEVNFWGLDAVVRAAVPSMLERRAGSVLAISTIAAQRSLRFEAYYGASKAALQRYMGSLDAEHRSRGLRFQCLSVGFIDTGFFHRGGWFGMRPPSVAGSGVTAQDVAAAAAQMLEDGRAFRLLGWRERLIALGDRVAPSLYDRWTRAREK